MNFLKNIFGYNNNKDIKIELPVIEEAVKANQAHEWFINIYKERKFREELWKSSFWVKKNIPKNRRILETGCGIGLNLFWFWENNYSNLIGTDVEDKYIAAAKEISKKVNYNIEFLKDDGLNPTLFRNEKFDLIVALNWTYLVENFDLFILLKKYSLLINEKAHLIIDLIDKSYDQIPDNQYQTSDIIKPIELRRPSEYKIRYSEEEIHAICLKAGYSIREIIKTFTNNVIPRFVYILQWTDL